MNPGLYSSEYSNGIKTVIKIGRNEIIDDGRSIFINGINLEDIDYVVDQKQKNGKRKSAEIQNGRKINKKILKYLDEETLDYIRSLDEYSLEVFIEEVDKIVDKYKQSDRFKRNAYFGLPAGLLNVVAGTTMLATNPSINCVFVFMAAAFFLGASIPALADEKYEFKRAMIEKAVDMKKEMLLEKKYRQSIGNMESPYQTQNQSYNSEYIQYIQ